MKKTKHHYIPKFVLKNFADKGKLYIYRHESKKIFCSSISDSFVENNLNTLKNRNGEKNYNYVEDIYDKYFENKATLPIIKIINDLNSILPSGKDFSAEDYLNLLRFAVLSHFRTPFSIEDSHHAARVSSYGMILLKYFIDFGTVEFPYDLDVEDGVIFSFLDNFDDLIRKLLDLKLTLYYHDFQDEFFLIPDQYVILYSPSNSKFGDKEFKMYFPISSKVVVCFERVQRDFYQGSCKIDSNAVADFNKYFFMNSFETVGCQNFDYLNHFIEKYNYTWVPLERFDPLSDFEKEKNQIKYEIISKLMDNKNGNKYCKGIITSINKEHEFKILTETEFKKIKNDLNSVFEINTRKIKYSKPKMK